MGGSSSSQTSNPVDMTPEAYAALQQPFAQTLGNLLGFGTTTGTTSTGSTSSTTSTGTSPASSYVSQKGEIPAANGQYYYNGKLYSPDEGAIIDGQQRYSTGTGNGAEYLFLNPSTTGSTTTTGTTGITGNTGDPLSGIPTYSGPLTAGITNNETALLDMIMRQATGQSGSVSQDFLTKLISGSEVPGQMTPEQAKDFVSRLGLGNNYQQLYNPTQSLSQFAQTLQGAQQTQGYSPDQNNPFVQAAIEAATRPILQNLTETLDRALPGQFTQAGQFVQPRGSSAFDRAAAIATRGATQEIGDISSTISYNAFEAERARQFEAQEGARQREAEALAQELERRGQYEEAERTRADAAREAANARQSGATSDILAQSSAEREAALNRQMEAASQLPAVQKQEIDNLTASLEAEALPRLIEDLGIERGIEAFNNQMNALLGVLGITAGVTMPTVATESDSSSSSLQLK